jgi:hypothetical protein
MAKMSMPAFMGSKMLAPGATTGGYFPYRGPVPDKRPRLGWWDVADPVAYFGIKGKRTEEQKERVRQFRQEWGDPKGGAVLNGFINGEYTAQQVDRYFGSTNFNAMIESDAYQGTIGAYEGDFGAFLQREWDNLGSWMGDNTSLDMELGVLTTAPTQGLGGPTGAERGATLNTSRLAQENYMQAIRAAATEADVPLIVDSPDGAVYELNVGQFGDVGLGEYKQVKEPYDAIDIAGQIMGEVIKAVLVAGVTGEIGSAISDVMSFAENVQTADEVRENVGVLQQIVDTYVENKDLVDDIMGTVDDIIDTSTESVVPEDVEIDSSVSDAADQQPADEVLLPAQTTIEEVEEEEPVVVEPVVEETAEEEPSFQEQVVEAIEAGPEGDVSDTKDTVDLDLFADTTDDDTTTGDLSDDVDFGGEVDDGFFILDALQEADFNAGNDVVLPDGTVINNRTHEMTGTPGYGGGIIVTERPTPDESGGGGAGGGGGAADTTTPTTTETTTTDTGEGDTIYADEPSTGLEVGDGTDELIDQLEEAIEAETDDATREDLEEVLEDLKETQAEEPEEAVEQPEPDVFDPAETTAETTETEEAGADEDDEDGLLFIPSFPEEEEEVETPDDVVTTEAETDETVVDDDVDLETEVTADTVIEDTTEDPADLGDSTVGDGAGDGDGDGGVGDGVGDEGEGEAGTGEAGAGEEGAGEEGVGDDGTGEGEGGDGTGEGEGDEDAPVVKPRGMMAASRFQPYAGGGVQGQLPGFVGVEYQPKDYMVELNRIIGESLFGDMIS